MIFISEDEKKTEEMIKYEAETGKKAIWRSVVTEGFKKWQKGEKIYIEVKERLNILISEEKKNRWLKFAKANDIKTLSRLIRQSVDFYIDTKPKMSELRDFYKSVHELKEKLSSIKGFSQMLIEEYKDELSWDVLLKVKEIFDNSVNIENIINNILNVPKEEIAEYDILIVDDDESTIQLLSEFFKKKGFSSKDTSLGTKAIELLQYYVPRLILLDILLPDNSGYDICKMIKSDKKLKSLPVYYITAVPENEVREKLSETGANGYFLKPFNMTKFNVLFDYL